MSSEILDYTTFLPLMLQAQDLVTKLESRVIELENDLETISGVHEQEREHLLEEIGEKDEYIYNLQTKINRFEFGTKETITVLAKTLETFKSRININNNNNINNVEDDSYGDRATKTIEQTDLEEQHRKSHKRQSSSYSIRKRRDSKVTLSDDEKLDHKLNIVGSNVVTNRALVDQSLRRESIISQISLDDLGGLDEYDLDGEEDIAEFNISDEEDSNVQRVQCHSLTMTSSPSPSPRNSFDGSRVEKEKRRPNSKVTLSDDEKLDHKLNIVGSNVVTNRALVDQSLRRESIISQISLDDLGGLDEYDLDGEEDIAEFNISDEEDSNVQRVQCHSLTMTSSPSPSPRNSFDGSRVEKEKRRPINSCTNCNILLVQIDQFIDDRAYLKRDLSKLATSLSKEQTIRKQIQASRKNLEQEIDRWVNVMFEKVNHMVSDEARIREELGLLNREYDGKFESLIKTSDIRQEQLRELKSLLIHIDSTKQKRVGSMIYPDKISELSSADSFMTNEINKNDEFGATKGKNIYIDGIAFEEFQEFIKSLKTSPTFNNNAPNATSAFMKRCMTEDIQPCLFEKSTGWKSPFYKKRLIDAIIKNQCEIQKISSSKSISSQTSSDNSLAATAAPIIVKCGLCGKLRTCEFAMRLSGSDATVPSSINANGGWILLDRFCRDRIVAVCDFYGYLSHLRQGLFNNSPIWKMYKQCLKYRRKMSLARVGSVTMVLLVH
ncbi:10331_t:CDS:2 [Entrophospora sp. SA101]|nr:10331_t:CDS:2 [Entrophospora sp. SA101]